MNVNKRDHVGDAEMARIMEESRLHPERSSEIADRHPHLSSCLTCRQKYDGLVVLDGRLRSILSAPIPQSGDCPRPGVWHEIAGGLTPSDQTLAHIEHASRCDNCGPLLHRAVSEMAELKGEITEAEQTCIVSLESASAEWQQNLAQRIAKTPRANHDRESMPWRSQWLTVPRLVLVGASLAAVIAAGSWYEVYRQRPAAADQLLARAYTEKRTLELRIAGADYAPLSVSLGPAASFTSRSPALLKAEALIASQFQSHPSDPAWLQAKAQADVLEGRCDAAVEALQRAVELDPYSPALLIDLATAYYQRAQQEDKKEDLGTAYESLSQALKLSPNEPVALFNRAIVAEHLFLYQQASEDWAHYLRLDASSQWAEEARSRANAVREKLKAHATKALPMLSPEQIVASEGNPDLASRVDDRIDEYLSEAVGSWLLQAFPEPGGRRNPSAEPALFFLANLTEQKHSDQWLSNLLRGSSAANFSQAVSALAHAYDANQVAEFQVAREKGDFANRLFLRSGNIAGALRAEFEQLYTAQVDSSDNCVPKAVVALEESERHSYPWLQIQLGLERAVCGFRRSDVGADEKATHQAMQVAEKNGYDALYLRAAVFEASDEEMVGDRSGSVALILKGLERYWSGQFPPRRGYSLYTVLAQFTEYGGVNEPNLRVAVGREAVRLADVGEDPVERGNAHNFLAGSATAAGLPQMAVVQYAEAARLFAGAPKTSANHIAAVEAEIRMAQSEAQLGHFDDAIARLTRVQDELRLLPNEVKQMFYASLGELQLGRHREAEAERAFSSAVHLAEQDLASLTSESERTTRSQNAAPVYLGLAESELILGQEQDALNTFESYLGAPQRGVRQARAARAHNPEPSESRHDPDGVLARLPLLSNQTVVAYGVLPDGLAIWVYDNRGVSGIWIPKSPPDLQDLASAFYAKCSDPNSETSALRRDSKNLYTLLIAPIEQRLDPKRTLVIEAEGFLARLPFEALVDADDRYLIERGPIVHSPGPYTEQSRHAETTISSSLPILVVGSEASLPEAGLFVVPDVSAGTQAVAKAFHTAQVLEGPDATISAVTKALPSAAVFHFSGHTIDTSKYAGLLLKATSAHSPQTSAVPSLLDSSLVRSLDLRNLQLAVLAACSTDGGTGGSRGFDSVAQAFQTSGVPHVVASRWAVDSFQTRAFADSFYNELLSGREVSTATRITSQKMLSNPRTAHPYYWAAFAAYGRP